jgi:hypothetical protein
VLRVHAGEHRHDERERGGTADGVPDLSFPFTVDRPATLGIMTYSSDGVPYGGDSAALCQGTCPGAGTCATGTLGQAPVSPFAGAPLTPAPVYDLPCRAGPARSGRSSAFASSAEHARRRRGAESPMARAGLTAHSSSR